MASDVVGDRTGITQPSSNSDPKQLTQSHSRTYQACIPCRRRKVRCDLGPVDAPHEPPCVRCRRESKECFFSATRRKRKLGSEEVDGYTNDIDDDFVARNGRRRTSYTTASPDTQNASATSPRRLTGLASSPTASAFNSHPQDGQERSQPSIPYYVDAKGANQVDDQDQEVANETAAALLRAPINTPGDALHLLLEASGRTESLHQHDSNGQGHPSMTPSSKLRSVEQSRLTRTLPPASHQRHNENIDPAIASNSESRHQPESLEVSNAIAAWSRLRFVRAGWFTAEEAISYIDYFYQYLAPLTPISPPEFSSLATHPSFLNDEPLLVVTVLTIASRYMQLTGPGAKSRSYMVHERLWSYLQNMITRMFWGQEQFGGGFCGAGSRMPKVTTKGGLRTLGTIESLLLLSEYHPRSMHFPPGDDGDDILTTLDEERNSDYRNNATREQPSFGETTVVSWSEPALRSDRMCWSLIGMSYTLAYELGVFGNYQNGLRSPQFAESRVNEPSLSPCEQRIDRIERLLYIYIHTASGRFGLPTMYARPNEDTDLRHIQARIGAHLETRNPIDTVQGCWMEMTMVMKACNASLFTSKDQTQALIQSGGYVAVLEQLQPLMNSYHQKLDAAQIPKYQWIILSIELEYVKLYIYSLALQAVLGHFTGNVAPGNEEQVSSISFSIIYKRNETYITKVVKAARRLLNLVVDGLLPGDYLKHAPVRTHFRILSGAMFLLKTFAHGAKEDEVSISLQLLDSTVQALRTSVVDDVHLSLRIADLLEGITSSIRHKFVRLPARVSNSNRGTPPKSAYASPSGTTPSNSRNIQQLVPPFQQYQSEQQQQHGLPGPTSNFDNISIMPPPDASYQFNLNSYGGNDNNAALSPFNNNNNNNNEEDWLTLNLNPLLSSDSTGFQTGVGNDGQWFGNFGPEINENLEVLGRLVEGWETTGLTGFP